MSYILYIYIFIHIRIYKDTKTDHINPVHLHFSQETAYLQCNLNIFGVLPHLFLLNGVLYNTCYLLLLFIVIPKTYY